MCHSIPSILELELRPIEEVINITEQHGEHPISGRKTEAYWLTKEGIKLLKTKNKKYMLASDLAYRLHDIDVEIMTGAYTTPKTSVVPKTNLVPVVEPKQRPIEDVINITEENGEILISGRELHEFLEIGTRYNDWFSRMCEYGFEENQDFIPITQKRVTAQGNYTTYTDHAMKIDMAKEISMLQRNEKGKEARQYFIKCEKKLREVIQTAPKLPQTYKEALTELVAQLDANERLEAENKKQQEVIQELKPKSEYCERILKSKGAVPITIIAKDYGMSAQAMNEKLKDLRIQRKVGKTWVLYQPYADKGYTSSYTGTNESRTGQEYSYVATNWTQKGRMFIYEQLKSDGIVPLLEQQQ